MSKCEVSWGKIDKARSYGGMTGDEALKLVWDQIGKNFEGHAKFLF